MTTRLFASSTTLVAPALLLLAASGCSDDASGDSHVDAGADAGADTAADTGGGDLPVPTTYAFPSLADPAASGVAYDGQIARHVLIAELNAFIGGLTTAIDGATFAPAQDGDVVAALDFYFRFDSSTDGETELRAFNTDPAPLQSTFNDVSTDKDIVGKLAGNDASTDHVDWTTAFAGWSDATIATHGGSITSPEGLVVAFFETIEANALAHAEGNFRAGPGVPVLPVHVTETGLDLQQLTQKFLLMGVAFSQAADDYLDDDLDGKGLLSSNEWDGSAAYTALGHAWDEGFGYFGAAVDYADYTDDEIAAAAGDTTRDEYERGYHDTDGDGAIDLLAEFNFGASTNPAKRDRGSVAPTDFTGDAFAAFLEGRTIIQNAGHPLTDDELAQLRDARDRAIGAWELAIVATVVHYINDTIADMDAFGTDDYSFLDHAKHWGEMKGFALGFQFNPASPLSDEQFAQFHALVGDAPVLEAAGTDAVAAYRADLLAARDLLEVAYGLDPANAEAW